MSRNASEDDKFSKTSETIFKNKYIAERDSLYNLKKKRTFQISMERNLIKYVSRDSFYNSQANFNRKNKSNKSSKVGIRKKRISNSEFPKINSSSSKLGKIVNENNSGLEMCIVQKQMKNLSNFKNENFKKEKEAKKLNTLNPQDAYDYNNFYYTNTSPGKYNFKITNPGPLLKPCKLKKLEKERPSSPASKCHEKSIHFEGSEDVEVRQVIRKYLIYINELLGENNNNNNSDPNEALFNQLKNKNNILISEEPVPSEEEESYISFKDEIEMYKDYLHQVKKEDYIKDKVDLIMKYKEASSESVVRLPDIKVNKYMDKTLHNVYRRVTYLSSKNVQVTEDLVVNLIKEESEMISKNLDTAMESLCSLKGFSAKVHEKGGSFILPFLQLPSSSAANRKIISKMGESGLFSQSHNDFYNSSNGISNSSTFYSTTSMLRADKYGKLIKTHFPLRTILTPINERELDDSNRNSATHKKGKKRELTLSAAKRLMDQVKGDQEKNSSVYEAVTTEGETAGYSNPTSPGDTQSKNKKPKNLSNLNYIDIQDYNITNTNNDKLDNFSTIKSNTLNNTDRQSFTLQTLSDINNNLETLKLDGNNNNIEEKRDATNQKQLYNHYNNVKINSTNASNNNTYISTNLNTHENNTISNKLNANVSHIYSKSTGSKIKMSKNILSKAEEEENSESERNIKSIVKRKSESENKMVSSKEINKIDYHKKESKEEEDDNTKIENPNIKTIASMRGYNNQLDTVEEVKENMHINTTNNAGRSLTSNKVHSKFSKSKSNQTIEVKSKTLKNKSKTLSNNAIEQSNGELKSNKINFKDLKESKTLKDNYIEGNEKEDYNTSKGTKQKKNSTNSVLKKISTHTDFIESALVTNSERGRKGLEDILEEGVKQIETPRKSNSKPTITINSSRFEKGARNGDLVNSNSLNNNNITNTVKFSSNTSVSNFNPNKLSTNNLLSSQRSGSKNGSTNNLVAVTSEEGAISVAGKKKSRMRKGFESIDMSNKDSKNITKNKTSTKLIMDFNQEEEEEDDNPVQPFNNQENLEEKLNSPQENSAASSTLNNNANKNEFTHLNLKFPKGKEDPRTLRVFPGGKKQSNNNVNEHELNSSNRSSANNFPNSSRDQSQYYQSLLDIINKQERIADKRTTEKKPSLKVTRQLKFERKNTLKITDQKGFVEETQKYVNQMRKVAQGIENLDLMMNEKGDLLSNFKKEHRENNFNEFHFNQDIKFHMLDENSDEGKKRFQEFMDQMENLKNFDVSSYVNTLEKNYDEIKEELENLTNLRKREERLNQFQKCFMNNREKTQKLRDFWDTKLVVKNNRFKATMGPLLH